jgi:tRNA (cmo5U34)-methyltransferase
VDGKAPASDVGQGISAANAGWSFAGRTVESFDEHVRRSIPGYQYGHELVEALSDFFVHDDSVCYELGTSTGELIGRLARRHAVRKPARWIGIDIEPDMVSVARRQVSDLENVTIELADITRYGLLNSDLIVSYYCLQFVPAKYRQKVVNEIYRALDWGGAFIWFEKVRANDARFQDMLTTLYTDFKVSQGFDAEQILAKTRSLKGVLDPFSSEANRDILARAGFVDFVPIFRDLCFEGLLVVK